MTARPRVGISRCLLGDEVRYDGGHRREPLLAEAVADEVQWVPVCPEVEVGMGVPREPIQLVRSGGVVRMLGVGRGEDWTERMQRWSRQRLAELEALELAGFVLKARSPSCGPRDVPVHTAGQAAASGRGMFADALLGRFHDLPVADEEQLRDAGERARFLERVRDYQRRFR